MKKIFLDTNIILDSLLGRNTGKTDINEYLPLTKPGSLYLSALSVHITYYVMKEKWGSERNLSVRRFFRNQNIIPLDEQIIKRAIEIKFPDFEDLLQYLSAIKNCSYILTRDTKDFQKIKKIIPSDIEIISTLKEIL